MKPLFGLYFVAAIFVVFTGMAAAGIYMIASPGEAQVTQPGNKPISAEVRANSKGVDVKVTTYIPGLVVFLLGATGLVLMLVKVPVKQILGYKEPPRRRSPPGTMALLASTSSDSGPIPVLDDKIQRVPVLLWWLAKVAGTAVRVPDKG